MLLSPFMPNVLKEKLTHIVLFG